MKKYFTFGIFIITFIIFLSSCQNKFIIEPVPEPTDTASFSQQIAPIFTEQGCVGCHGSSGQQPSLTPDNAYNSITGLNLVVANNPDQSIIYYVPKPDGEHYAKYTSSQYSLVLQWINEGALDN